MNSNRVKNFAFFNYNKKVRRQARFTFSKSSLLRTMAGSKIASATLTFPSATGVVGESEIFSGTSQSRMYVTNVFSVIYCTLKPRVLSTPILKNFRMKKKCFSHRVKSAALPPRIYAFAAFADGAEPFRTSLPR